MAVPYAPRDYYHPQGVERLIDLVSRRGDIAAQGAINSGKIWGGAVNSLGGIAQDYFQERQRQKELAPRLKIQELQAKALEAEQTAGDSVANYLSTTPIDKIEYPKIIGMYAHDPIKGLQTASAIKSFESIGKEDIAKSIKGIPQIIGAMDQFSDEHKAAFWPALVSKAEAGGIVPPGSLPKDFTPQVWEQVKNAASQLAPPDQNMTEWDVIMRAAGGDPAKAWKLKTEADQAKEAPKLAQQAARDAETASYHKGMLNKPTGVDTPSLQAKEVLDDEGKPVMATFNPKTGKYSGPTGPIKDPKPMPTDRVSQDQNKFKKAAPILSSISELSDRINTQQGLLAKMSGGASKLAAKANYDDDVAEYQSLVEGFTPMIARAVGHVGVLTQRDVDSVKELFPKPGDSKTLRDRKIARVKSIMSELESAGAAGAETKPTSAAPPEMVQYKGQKVPFKSLPLEMQQIILNSIR